MRPNRIGGHDDGTQLKPWRILSRGNILEGRESYPAPPSRSTPISLLRAAAIPNRRPPIELPFWRQGAMPGAPPSAGATAANGLKKRAKMAVSYAAHRQSTDYTSVLHAAFLLPCIFTLKATRKVGALACSYLCSIESTSGCDMGRLLVSSADHP
jgi:hypothetical protein